MMLDPGFHDEQFYLHLFKGDASNCSQYSKTFYGRRLRLFMIKLKYLSGAPL
jgi:hypothetical protein